MKPKLLSLLVLITFSCVVNAQHYTIENGRPTLTEKGASHFAGLAMKCIVQEFPNKTGHIQLDNGDTRQPSEYHPAFYGCFDWHSAVHGHWMLVKLLKVFPTLPEAERIRNTIRHNLTHENILHEVDYFNGKMSKAYERTYGWAWLLKLADELQSWDDEDGRNWAKALKPLEELIANRYIEYLPKQMYPTRTGTHSNTAFGLSLALDYSINVGNKTLETVLKESSMKYFGNDKSGPASWEPGSSDFFSPCLLEAELMSKVMKVDDYRKWLDGFIPDLSKGEPSNLFSPVTVSDRNDLQLVHLDGLNLSRAWCFISISSNIEDKTTQQLMRDTAIKHLNATLPQIADGDYAGEHWLASFAVYALLN